MPRQIHPGPEGWEHDWKFRGGPGLPSVAEMAKRPHVKGGTAKVIAEHRTKSGGVDKLRNAIAQRKSGSTARKVTGEATGSKGGPVSSGVRSARTQADRKKVYQQAKQRGELGKIPADWKPDGSLRGGGPQRLENEVASPEYEAKVASMWANVRKGSEHIAEPGVQISNMTDHPAAHQAAYRESEGLIRIKPQTLDDTRTSKDKKLWFSDTGNHTLGERTLHHEYGHHLDTQLHNSDEVSYYQMRTDVAKAIANGNGKRKMTMSKRAETEIERDPNEWLRQNHSKVIHTVGTYASTNHKETIAELWAEHRLSSNPSPAANIVGDYLTGRKVAQ